MNLRPLILDKLQSECRGMGNAITRERLLVYLQEYDPELTDRDMRKFIKKRLPKVCSCSKGYFLACEKRQSDITIEQYKKRIFASWKIIKQIEEAYPEFYPKGIQMRLF